MQGDCFAKCVPEMLGCKCEMSAKIGTLSLSKCVPGMLFISANISNFICPSPMDCHNDAGMRAWELGWHCVKIDTLSLSKCMLEFGVNL